ncbi:helix-turn-helix transcriptional regulator [Pararhizobium sp. LjRoot255]|uniref:helix-turn-helix domain-containing protein n=1 Tax=Pararhizobium sp. LjRoot255 TaxID=3342298 RepID=UPI003ED144CC
MESFAANLKKRAYELGLSNAEVARRAGLTERRYGNYITGRREPDLATLVRIANVLESTPNALLDFEKDATPRTTDDLLKAKIASAVNALKDSDLEVVAIAIEAVANYRMR